MYPPSGKHENLSERPWASSTPPRRILVIRMHAIGDTAITLPVLAALHRRFPHATIDFLTTAACAPLFDTSEFRGSVIAFPHTSTRAERIVHAIQFGQRLRRNDYDMVIDLQRNWVTRVIRRVSSPAAWAEFDRFDAKPAADRTIEAVRRIGITDITHDHRIPMKASAIVSAKALLRFNGWDERTPLIVLNPAGLWPSRQWPLENYIALAKLMKGEGHFSFLLLGTNRIRQKAGIIEKELGGLVINLVEKTTLGMCLAILHLASGVVSEDSGLMHMAWAFSVPTVALLGSTNHVWSAPTGDHVRVFHSGDLPCGACMQPECFYSDVHCLTRVTPEAVRDALAPLLKIRHDANTSTAEQQPSR